MTSYIRLYSVKAKLPLDKQGTVFLHLSW